VTRPLVAGGLTALLFLLLLAPPRATGRLRRLGVPGRTARSRGRPVDALAGPLVLDLVAAVIGAGAPVPTALRLVADAVSGYSLGVAEHVTDLARRHELAVARPSPDSAPRWVKVLDRTLVLARDAGVPPSALLASAATDERRRRAARRRVAAARLGVRLVVPTGACLLPAFVLLTVVPMVLALLGG
jgi:tight adherence protein B